MRVHQCCPGLASWRAIDPQVWSVRESGVVDPQVWSVREWLICRSGRFEGELSAGLVGSGVVWDHAFERAGLQNCFNFFCDLLSLARNITLICVAGLVANFCGTAPRKVAGVELGGPPAGVISGLSTITELQYYRI